MKIYEPLRDEGHEGRRKRGEREERREMGLFAVCLLLIFPQILFFGSAFGSVSSALRVVVGSNEDVVRADDVVTLREAIKVVNGTLPLDKLSAAERVRVSVSDVPRIEFNLPKERTTIYLKDMLPELAVPGLVVDGTTQPGYGVGSGELGVGSGGNEQVPTPIVAITGVNNNVLRGLTIVADNIQVRGLSLYGFTSQHLSTESLPPADIFISDGSEKEDDKKGRNVNPPRNVVIENNWLGVSPDSSKPLTTSAFGVSIFNAVGTVVRRNKIAHHDGSAIISAVKAENSLIQENIITENGFAGMPDAIRLEGFVNGTRILSNVIFGNHGSGVFLFKPLGSVVLENNEIKSNGASLRRAAVYLMGNGHQVLGNRISEQSGPGVVVAAYPQSYGNAITGNLFTGLAGLSIDLVAQQNTGVKEYQDGDGGNPVSDSLQRRRKTGNFGVDAPRFLSPEFFVNRAKGSVSLDGRAVAGSVVQIYQVTEDGSVAGPLNLLIGKTTTDDKGVFSITVDGLGVGERVSAIVTHPQYGTSEPAVNAVVRDF
jgi:parallel beta-helix repeat protein